MIIPVHLVNLSKAYSYQIFNIVLLFLRLPASIPPFYRYILPCKYYKGVITSRLMQMWLAACRYKVDQRTKGKYVKVTYEPNCNIIYKQNTR